VAQINKIEGVYALFAPVQVFKISCRISPRSLYWISTVKEIEKLYNILCILELNLRE